MHVPSGYQQLAGSERHPPAAARLLGPSDPAERLSVTIVLRRRPDGQPVPDVDEFRQGMQPPPSPVGSDEFARRHGASPDDIARVTAFATSHGLAVDEVNSPGRTMKVSGTVAQMQAAFAVDLGKYEATMDPGVRSDAKPATITYHGRDGFIHVPAELANVIVGVFGLDNRPIAQRNMPGDPPNTVTTTVPQIVQLYGWPTNSAAGQTIGIFAGYGGPYGTGYKSSDITQYFGGLSGFTAPAIVDVSVDGTTSDASNPDAEATQDICIASTVAQGAQIAVYLNAGDENGWVQAITRAVHPMGGDPHPSVLSSSFYISNGDDTATITSTMGVSIAFVDAMHNVFADAALNGVTICIASGDTGTDSKVGDGKAHVQFPGSDPWVLSVGGTTVGNISGSTFDEYVWNDTIVAFSANVATGGGVSDRYGLPAYQQNAGVPASLNAGHNIGRGVPDVAANGSYNSGYPMIVNGAPFVGNGTSASAPLYAGLIAMINAAIGRPVGFINPTLYALGSSVFRDIVGAPGPADNGLNGVPGYPAGAGWDACTGWGVASSALLPALQALYTPSCSFIVERSTVGKDEVDSLLLVGSPNTGIIDPAFWVYVDGYTPAELGITAFPPTHAQLIAAAPVVTPSPAISGLFIEPVAVASDDPTTPPDPQVQRLTFEYRYRFTDDTGFNFMGEVEPVTLTAIVQTVSSTAAIELIKQPNPYLTHGQVAWLAVDLQVFSINATQTKFGFTCATAAQANDYIKNVVEALNAHNGSFSGDSFDSLNPNDQETAIYVYPQDAQGHNVFDFALAKVRYRGNVLPANHVRVFFRMFQAQTTNTVFDPSTTYRRYSDGMTDGQAIARLGIVGNEYVTIPFFAMPRVDSTTVGMDTQTDTNPPAQQLNVRDLPASGAVEADYYFGCWLDINQADNRVPAHVDAAHPDGPFQDSANPPLPIQQAIMRSHHQCLVAEIAFDHAVVPAGANPGNSDKLAQRNLAWVDLPNPGIGDSRRALTTFDIKPTAAFKLPQRKPDELMIDSRTVPAGTTAEIYLPAVSASEVVRLADEMYAAHNVALVDAHTVRCLAGGITYLPVPSGGKANFAGLLTLQLPATMKRGDRYDVVVRQITGATGRVATGSPTRTGKNATTSAEGRSISWRKVLGAFQLALPVSTKQLLLPKEERLYALLLWVAEAIRPSSRWYPVFHRYLQGIGGRIGGFGGDPGSIKPSPSGKVPGHVTGRRGRDDDRDRDRDGDSVTGKIDGIVFDHFGDFEGFVLETRSGEYRRFRSRASNVFRIVERAWAGSITTTVMAEEDGEVRKIELRGEPPDIDV